MLLLCSDSGSLALLPTPAGRQPAHATASAQSSSLGVCPATQTCHATVVPYQAAAAAGLCCWILGSARTVHANAALQDPVLLPDVPQCQMLRSAALAFDSGCCLPSAARMRHCRRQKTYGC